MLADSIVLTRFKKIPFLLGGLILMLQLGACNGFKGLTEKKSKKGQEFAAADAIPKPAEAGKEEASEKKKEAKCKSEDKDKDED